MTISAADIPSPCVRVCQIDRKTGWCLGCWRTGAEIGAWPTMDAPGRLALLDALPARKQAWETGREETP